MALERVDGERWDLRIMDEVSAENLDRGKKDIQITHRSDDQLDEKLAGMWEALGES